MREKVFRTLSGLIGILHVLATVLVFSTDWQSLSNYERFGFFVIMQVGCFFFYYAVRGNKGFDRVLRRYGRKLGE